MPVDPAASTARANLPTDMRCGGNPIPNSSSAQYLYCPTYYRCPGARQVSIRPVTAIAFLILLAPALGSTTEPAKVLVLGNPPNIRVVAQWLDRDPMADPTQVPCRTHLTNLQGADIQRFIRN